MALYSVRSERLFCEQLDYNLLFRWFLDMGIEDASFDHSTFSQNRERLLEHDVARQFFMAVMSQAQSAGLTSNEHFSVDGSLIDAWASLKSFRPKEEKKNERPPPDDKGNPASWAILANVCQILKWPRRALLCAVRAAYLAPGDTRILALVEKLSAEADRPASRAPPMETPPASSGF